MPTISDTRRPGCGTFLTRNLAARHRDSAGRQAGLSLVEMLVAIVMIVVVMTAALVVFTRGMRISAVSERDDQSVALAQDVLSRARQTSFAELGFFENDPDAPPVGVPIMLPIEATNGLAVSEPPISLGEERHTGTRPFVPRVQRIVMDTRQGEATYRVETTVTNPTGAEPATARRVTVNVQRAFGDVTHLTGDCTQEGTECVVQSTLRAATASDFDQVSGQMPEPACLPGQDDLICDAYIRSGRVLDGATMVSDQDIPEQVAPVDLFVRTADPASRVIATWQWRNADGAVIRSVDHEMTGGSDGTRWNVTIAPDPLSVDGLQRQQQGYIRPGRITVTFRATTDTGQSQTRDVPAFWSFAAGEAATVGVALESAEDDWCTPQGGQAIQFGVEGLSIGFTPDTQNPSARDVVAVVFTTTDAAGRASTTRVPATVVPGSVETVNTGGDHGQVWGGWVNASFTAQVPPTLACNRAVAVVVDRAIDATRTPVTLMLPGSAIGAPDSPIPTLNINQDTGAVTASWNTVTEGASYRIAWSVAGGAFSAEQTITELSADLPSALPLGNTVIFRVVAVVAGQESAPSTVSGIRRPDAPVLSAGAAETVNTINAIRTNVPSATSYVCQIATNNTFTTGLATIPCTGTAFSRSGLASGTTFFLRAAAVNAGGQSTWSNTLLQTTLSGAPVLSAGAAETATVVGATRTNVDGATSYVCQLATNNAFTAGLRTVPCPDPAFSQGGLASGTTFHLRAAAVNAGGQSAWSNTLSQTTIPAAPVLSGGAAETVNTVNATRTDVTGATSFVCQMATNNAFSAGLVTIPCTGTNFSRGGLTPDTTIFLRAAAVNGSGQSAWSNTISQRTAMPALSIQPHTSGSNCFAASSGGWRPNVSSGTVGTVGQGRPVEALRFTTVGLEARAFVGQVASVLPNCGVVTGGTSGWTGWGGPNTIIGTTGQGRPINAVSLRSSHFRVEFRAHIRNVGWTAWTAGGATVGTAGATANWIEAIEVRISSDG